MTQDKIEMLGKELVEKTGAKDADLNIYTDFVEVRFKMRQGSVLTDFEMGGFELYSVENMSKTTIVTFRANKNNLLGEQEP